MKLINILMYCRCFVGRGHWNMEGKGKGFLKLLGLQAPVLEKPLVGSAC